jgi:drug/metabolite transporter (DMT)-like permease
VIALGYVVFGDLPDFWTLVGTALIITSGIYVFYREAYLRRVGRL